MALFRPSLWRSQPTGLLAIDWSAPLSSALKFVYTRDRLLTAKASYLPASIWASNAGLQPTPWGVGYKFGGNTADYVRWDQAYTTGVDEDFTLETYVVGSSYPSLAGHGGLSDASVTTGSYVVNSRTNRAILSFQGAGDPCNVYYTSNGGDLDSGVRFTVNVIQHVFVTYYLTGGFKKLNIWRNGVKLAGPFTPASTLLTAGPYFYLGGGFGGRAGTLNGVVVKSGFYNRALNDGEIAALTANPWAQFAPIRRAIFFAPAAAGGGQSLDIPVADVAWAALAPVVDRKQSLVVPVADVAWAGLAPVIDRKQSLDIPVADVAWAALAPVVDRKQSLVVPVADVAWAGLAPVVSQSGSGAIDIPVADIAWAALAPVVDRKQSLVVPVADVTWAGLAPVVNQGQSVSLPIADVAWSALAPTVDRKQSIAVPVANVDWDGIAPVITVSGVVIPPAILAQMYGGGAMYPRKKKKKKEEPTIEEMVEAIAEEPKGKEKIVALLPKKVKQELPDAAWEVSVDKLVREVKDASDRVQKGVERLYEKRRQKDDDEAFMLLNL